MVNDIVEAQQLSQSVGDLPLAQMKQRAEQRELRWLRMLAQVHRRLDRSAGAPPGGHADGADRFEL